VLDAVRCRADFPILARSVNDKPLVYLDSAATSQKPRVVIDALVRYYEETNANVHRGAHTLAEEATTAYEDARAKVARFIGAADANQIVFTRNTTESINLVAQSWGRANLRPGDEIVATEMEHHSNLVPWQMMAAATGATLRVAPVRADDGVLYFDALAAMVGPRTRLVAVGHASNVLGTINPIRPIADLAHAHGALLLVDGAQSVPHMPVDVGALGADFLAFSGHKMCGPTGIGVLWGRPELLDAMPPFLGGGSMIREVWNDRATWAEPPARFEAGTPNIADAIALGTAIDYLEGVGMKAIRAHSIELTRYGLDRLRAIGGVRVYGPANAAERVGVISFNLYGDLTRPETLIHPHDLGTVLDGEGIAIRTGHHCCNPLMRRLEVPATARASFYLYNTPSDVDRLVDGLIACRELFT
jgi:cysteine desulfurase/selenocysteine lyase